MFKQIPDVVPCPLPLDKRHCPGCPKPCTDKMGK